ncbi:MAG: TetR/AcrR family transcriptional regulator [Firmicutes bacterium]|nr:TetR/AcrR family transcriptional regulator [Alicyclobacillaceae bacterium]MCL6497412.1 TetR/AcrR family transcriptional regulator [Bacillota bacterium]
MDRRGRRAAIVAAATQEIAERGLEGFRLRAVAERVGLHHATVLHYFPTKEALLRAVVEALLEALRQEGRAQPAKTPWEALEQEWHDLGRRLSEAPAFFVVLAEFELRAFRDPAVASALHPLFSAWREYLQELVRRGMAAGAMRRDLPVAAVVESLMVQFRGFGLRVLDGVEGAALAEEIGAAWAVWRRGLAPAEGEADASPSPWETSGDTPVGPHRLNRALMGGTPKLKWRLISPC